jgi:hypothetical protein
VLVPVTVVPVCVSCHVTVTPSEAVPTHVPLTSIDR